MVQALRKKAEEENCELVVVSAKVEAELQDMPKEEAAEWLEMLGVTDGGLGNLIRATYKALGLQVGWWHEGLGNLIRATYKALGQQVGRGHALEAASCVHLPAWLRLLVPLQEAIGTGTLSVCACVYVCVRVYVCVHACGHAWLCMHVWSNKGDGCA